MVVFGLILNVDIFLDSVFRSRYVGKRRIETSFYFVPYIFAHNVWFTMPVLRAQFDIFCRFTNCEHYDECAL